MKNCNYPLRIYMEKVVLGEHKRIIYCITNRFIYPKMKDLVLSVDPTAIIEASYSTETTGVKRPGRAMRSEK